MTAPGAFGWHVDGRCAATGKVRFGPSRAAQKIAEMAPTDPEARLLNAYRCEACGWWHVGHNRRLEVPS
jgi:hypothetical protein